MATHDGSEFLAEIDQPAALDACKTHLQVRVGRNLCGGHRLAEFHRVSREGRIAEVLELVEAAVVVEQQAVESRVRGKVLVDLANQCACPVVERRQPGFRIRIGCQFAVAIL